MLAEVYAVHNAPARQAMKDYFGLTVARFDRAWEIHFLTVFPVIIGMSLFDDLHHELFGDDSFAAFRLLQGLDNLTLEADRALYRLSRLALASPHCSP